MEYSTSNPIYNLSMEFNRCNIHKLPVFLLMFLVLVSCQSSSPTPEPRIETPALPLESSDTTTDQKSNGVRTEPEGLELPSLPPFMADSPFCEIDENNLLVSVCKNGQLTIMRADNPRRVDVFFNREVDFSADSGSIQAEVTSIPPKGLTLDQNQYGIYFIDRDGIYHAVRVFGQYFNFETWSMNEELEIESRYNRVFSPGLKPSGQSNFLELACTESLCELKINGQLAGRIPEGASRITRAGLFTAADWDQSFGQVTFSGFKFDEIDPNTPASQIFSLTDDLTEDHASFSDRGLAGAFHSYQSDGFHFSPVVPFNFYSATTGPSLADVSVEVTVTMEVDPGVSGSQFAGIACRTSQEGSYMAVIKVDGTYTLFRDTPQQPLAVLARKASDAILPSREANRLRLDCSGDQIDFYINGIQVASVTDIRYNVSFGRSGLFTKAGGDPNEDAIIFSDLLVTELL